MERISIPECPETVHGGFCGIVHTGDRSHLSYVHTRANQSQKQCPNEERSVTHNPLARRRNVSSLSSTVTHTSHLETLERSHFRYFLVQFRPVPAVRYVSGQSLNIHIQHTNYTRNSIVQL
jgi:hypothetical protein